MKTGERILDPICDMVVDPGEARDQGLVLEYKEREYGFCSAGCQTKFAKNPAGYVPKVETWLATNKEDARSAASGAHAHAASSDVLVIDAGMRAWYLSCRCCLSDAHPDVVAVLDRERATNREAPADAGICETAEAHETKTP